MKEFEFTIIHTSGVLHATTNYLSRIKTREVTTEVLDDFPYDDILMLENVEEIRIKGLDVWYKEIKYFLTQGIPPPGLKRD